MRMHKGLKWTIVIALQLCFVSYSTALEMPEFIQKMWRKKDPSVEAKPEATEPEATGDGEDDAPPAVPASKGGNNNEVRVKALQGNVKRASVVLDKHCPEAVQPYKLTDNLASVLNSTAEQFLRQGLSKDRDLMSYVKIAAKQLNWLPMSAEVFYGERLHAEETDILERTTADGRKYYPVADRMLQEILSTIDEPHEYEFKLFILKRDKRNAVARPGGFIYIDEGLLKDPAYHPKAYFALAHEVAHVLQRHETKEVQSMVIDSIQTKNDMIKVLRSVRGDPRVILAFVKLQKDMFTQHHVDQELQSDSCAARLLTRVFPQPQQLATSLAAFLRDLPKPTEPTVVPPPQSDIEKLALTVNSIVTDPIDRHPTTQQRYDNLRTLQLDIGVKPVATRPR